MSRSVSSHIVGDENLWTPDLAFSFTADNKKYMCIWKHCARTFIGYSLFPSMFHLLVHLNLSFYLSAYTQTQARTQRLWTTTFSIYNNDIKSTTDTRNHICRNVWVFYLALFAEIKRHGTQPRTQYNSCKLKA